MTTDTSLRLLLEDFLGLMREEGELDVFLTLVLSAMGHEIVYRAQKGVKQYGVDISSVGRDEEDGRKKLYLWVVKRGDIGRAEWNGSQQSILHSLEELVWVYLDSHVNPQHLNLPKKVMVLTNGDFQSTLNHTIATTFKKFGREHGIELEAANGSRLASWTEKYLLDEHLLPKDSRLLLRRMLANIATPELSLRSGRELVAQLAALATRLDGSASARKKRQLGAFRGLRTALSLARTYGLSENNLSTAYKLAEFAVLRMWSLFHSQAQIPAHTVHELAALRMQWTEIAFEYHGRMQTYYETENAFASVLPDSLLVAERAFEELGTLAVQAVHWASLGAQSGTEWAAKLAFIYVHHIRTLLETHSCTAAPPYDRHSAVVHAVLAALMMVNERTVAERWLEALIVRLAHAARNREHWPLSCSFEEALEIRWGEQEVTVDSCSTSTILPVLFTWAAALRREDLYTFLKDRVVPAKPDWCTMNFWSSDAGYDSVIGNGSALQEHGIAEGLLFVPETGGDFLERMSTPLDGIEPIELSGWYRQRAPHVPVLAALHWGVQIPRMMLVNQAVALCSQLAEGPAVATAA